MRCVSFAFFMGLSPPFSPAIGTLMSFLTRYCASIWSGEINNSCSSSCSPGSTFPTSPRARRPASCGLRRRQPGRLRARASCAARRPRRPGPRRRPRRTRRRRRRTWWWWRRGGRRRLMSPRRSGRRRLPGGRLRTRELIMTCQTLVIRWTLCNASHDCVGKGGKNAR